MLDISVGAICLARESKLHSLTPEMRASLEKQFDDWQDDPHIRHILLYAKGNRAFCSGADIRFFYESRQNPENNVQFCVDEYSFCQKILHYPKPCVALIDGLVMGGGVGISQYGKYKIATENYQFAMPEVQIGFFPDVGISHLFARMPLHIGWYLAMTGSRIGPERAASLGLVTHAICAAEKQMWVERILQMKDLEQELEDIALDIPFHPLPEDHEIEEHFSKPTVSALLQSLERSHTPFATQALTLLKTISPVSLLVTFEALKRSLSMSFEEVIAMDKHIASVFMHRPEVYEGIKAKIIDKNHQPHWTYPSLDLVPSSYIADFFLA